MSMAERILLVQDMTGYGKVALAAIMPVLSHMGHHIYTLPTAIVSNTLDYGQFEIAEMTDYMRKRCGCGRTSALPSMRSARALSCPKGRRSWLRISAGNPP